MKNESKQPQIFNINNAHTNSPENSDFTLYVLFHRGKKYQMLNNDGKKSHQEMKSRNY